jgi:hypothetical protein
MVIDFELDIVDKLEILSPPEFEPNITEGEESFGAGGSKGSFSSSEDEASNDLEAASSTVVSFMTSLEKAAGLPLVVVSSMGSNAAEFRMRTRNGTDLIINFSFEGPGHKQSTRIRQLHVSFRKAFCLHLIANCEMM